MDNHCARAGSGDGHDHSKCDTRGSTATQSLDELDFDRGIWSAAMDNDVDRLRTLITKGHLHDRDSCGYTALHYAARSGHRAACQLLLSSGLAVNEATKGGATALHRAAMMGHEEIVRLLLAHNADPSFRDADGRTPLHRAAEGGHLNCCVLLVEQNPALCQCEDAHHHKPIDLVRADRKNYDELKRALQ